jgi:uncharacterized membrane protein
VHKNNTISSLRVAVQRVGPLPPLSALSLFNEVFENGAERIFHMAHGAMRANAQAIAVI